MKVLAALSGGVDSAVAAARAVEAGHEVTAVHLALSRNPESNRNGARGCCTIEDSRDARRVADALGIPFYIWDLSETFKVEVMDDFIDEYAAGRTPNPCVRCNEKVKFAAVLDKGIALGFDAVCTGHYARIVDGADGPELHRATDPDKDQSYVLGVIGPEALRRSMFPLGGSTKHEVRAEAAERGLLVAEKSESFDVCFIPDGDTGAFLRSKIGAEPGKVVDENNEVVGEHDGAFAYTVGQRRGLRLERPAEDGKPRYVLSIEPVSNTVVVGPHERLAVRTIRTQAPRWCATLPADTFECLAQWRAHGEAARATATVGSDGVIVTLAEAAHGIAPGQEVVLYDGTRLLGSARVASAVA